MKRGVFHRTVLLGWVERTLCVGFTIKLAIPRFRDVTTGQKINWSSSNSLCSLGHFKLLFQACDKLQLQVNWNQATHHTVLDFPLTSICTFAGNAAEASSPTRRTFLVRDAYILSTQACILRARAHRERTHNRYNIARFHKATASNGLWRIKPFFRKLLDTLPSTPTPPNITADFYNLVSPTTRTGLTVACFKRKDFRYSFLTPLQDLPNDYPRATPGAWHRFWNSAHIPHRATTAYPHVTVYIASSQTYANPTNAFFVKEMWMPWWTPPKRINTFSMLALMFTKCGAYFQVVFL